MTAFKDSAAEEEDGCSASFVVDGITADGGCGNLLGKIQTK